MMSLLQVFGVLFLASWTLAQNESSYPTCPTIRCAPQGPPICATLNGEMQLLPTSCTLSHLRCLGKEWQEVELVQCAIDICPIDCDGEGSPVCATNGKKTKKFKSECDYRNYACRHHTKRWSRLLSC